MELAEGCDVVDAGIGAGVREHHEAIADEDSTAIGHDEDAPATAPPLWRASGGRGNAGSALPLPRRLVHLDLHRQRLARAAVAHAAHRRRTEIVEADRNADVRIDRANPVRGVERDPAEAGHEC